MQNMIAPRNHYTMLKYDLILDGEKAMKIRR